MVKPEEAGEKTTESGVIVPEANIVEKPLQGEVVATGKVKYVKKDDTVIFNKYAGQEIKLDIGEGEKSYIIIDEDLILGIIQNK